ncbi:hypothetical protein EN745_14670 [Mesorhizobium sp. M4A.F.Ca.ET.022.05.2.1]|uniref:hypothetical protein n=1 Tax=Mesorhizobium sp. M4A.F.Ca.ET.022.05.2.1 TaxID=2496653 RepID=UPI000FCC01E2|nr:hypothetical protein [Mesorhizobium sp. M4A.F.Ca.ET.022.05.2.1]RVC79880.1 hypothetical protein EN745_14670 [Mesorhizobium sp. M4A.F.Ca.ET.022.05.2.1]
MTDPHAALKAHCQSRLDREAAEHPSGHQNVHARRYLLPRKGRSPIEAAIIVKPDSKLQIWCEADGVDLSRVSGLQPEKRLGSETYSTVGASGNVLYGRHSALKTFDRLHRGDALRFVPETIGEVDRILDMLANRGAP